MAEDDYGPAQPVVDVIKGAYKKANDWMSNVPPKTDEEKKPYQADPDAVKKANESFVHPAQTAAQKKGIPAPTNGKSIITKVTRRKR